MDKSKEEKKSEAAKEEVKKNEIVIEVANDSPVRINVNIYLNAEQWESCDSKVSEDIDEQLENHHSKVIVIRNTFKKTGSKENNENVQTPEGSNDKMVRVKNEKKSFSEFLTFMKIVKSRVDFTYTRVEEINKNLFDMSTNYSLAHCVAEDFVMENGISLQFSGRFKGHSALYNQRQKKGGLAILNFSTRFIYYLVIKKFVGDKPTLRDMWNSLTKMQKHLEENNIYWVAIPQIGCGFNGLEWNQVKLMIEYIFQDTDVAITVCNFEQKEIPISAHNIIQKCQLVTSVYPAVESGLNSIIVYFGTEDGFISNTIEEMDKKFRILPDYKRGPRELGTVIRTEAFKESCLIIGFIFKKSIKNALDYTTVEKCAQEVNKINKMIGKRAYKFLALEKYQSPLDDQMQFRKVLDILRITLNTDVIVCACSSHNYF